MNHSAIRTHDNEEELLDSWLSNATKRFYERQRENGYASNNRKGGCEYDNNRNPISKAWERQKEN